MKYIYSLLFIGIISHANAQIQHIENKRVFNDTVRWTGTAEINFSAVQNRDLLVELGVQPFVQYNDSMNYFLALAEYNYSAGDVVYDHSLYTHLRYNRLFKKDIRWAMMEFFTQAQINPLLSQRIRALAGTGPRFRLFQEKNYRMFAGTAYMYEYEEIIADSSIQRNHRVSAYISWFFNPKSYFAFSGSTYYQPLLTDFRDYRFSGQYALSFKIFKRAAFKFEFGFLYDSRPPLEVRNFVFDAEAGMIFDLTGYNRKKKRK